MFWKWPSPWWSCYGWWRRRLFSLLPKLAYSRTVQEQHLICITPRWIQYSRVLFSISFLLYRACLTHLISSNLSCNLCLWYYDQLVHFNNKINAKVYRHSLWEYSKHFHCSLEWHLTPHTTVSIETTFRQTLQHSLRVSLDMGFTV